MAFSLVGALFLAGCGPEPTREPAAAPSGHEHVVAGPLQGRTGAYLIVGDAASRIQVILAALPGLLYRISTPAGSGLVPLVSGADGRIRAALRPTGADGPDEVRILLNRDVRWDIRLAAGAGEQQLDLVRGRISRVVLGPSGLVELRLPAPAGTIPVTLDSGVGTVALSAPAPVRIRLAEGAGAVTTPWLVQAAAAAGTVLEPRDWRTARDRYAVLARSGVGSLTLRRSLSALR